ncbi:MAG: hypothetical protein ACPGOV_16215 [Magnetovibrionaceae bacterium]
MFELLNAALAFTVLMIALSVVVAALVELVQAVFGMRSAGLRRMLARLYKDDIWPVLGERLLVEGQTTNGVVVTAAEVKSQKNRYREARRAFLEKMTLQRSVKSERDSRLLWLENVGLGWLRNLMRKHIFWDRFLRWLGLRYHTKMTLFEFAGRLADTEVGKRIGQGRNKKEGESSDNPDVSLLDNWFEGLAERFERYGQDIRADFAQRARTISILSAFVVAFVVNVDAGYIFHHLVNSPEKAALIADQFEAVVEQARKAGVLPPETAEDGRENAKLPTEGTAPGNPTTDDRADQAEAQLEEAKEALKESTETLKKLQDLGLPIGHAYFPFCRSDIRVDPRCPEAFPTLQDAKARLSELEGAKANIETTMAAATESAEAMRKLAALQVYSDPSGTESPINEATIKAVIASMGGVSDEIGQTSMTLSDEIIRAQAAVFLGKEHLKVLAQESKVSLLRLEIAAGYGDEVANEKALSKAERELISLDDRFSEALELAGFTRGEQGWGTVLTRITSGQGLSWVISTFIAGVLIGLGGPFWYRVGGQLISLRKLVSFRKPGDSGGTSQGQPANPSPPPANKEFEDFQKAVKDAQALFDHNIEADRFREKRRQIAEAVQ